MANIIINERQMALITNYNNPKSWDDAQKVWDKLNREEKEFVVESYKAFYPEKANLINESHWWNTVLDFVGIIDPTGVVDFGNGISYLSQEDYLFGFLTLLGAVPIVGKIADGVLKPVMAALKIGSPSVKAIEEVMKLSKMGKDTEAIEKLTAISKSDKFTAWVVGKLKGIMGSAKGMIEKLPNGVLKGFKNTLLEWCNLFEKAGAGTALRGEVGQLAKQYEMNVAKQGVALSKKSIQNNLEQLAKLAGESSGVFRNYRTPGKFFSWKTMWAGMPQLLNTNASMRALVRKTKWYMGLLDTLGIGHFVEPDELKKKMGDQKFQDAISKYNSTAQAQDNMKFDFGSGDAAAATTGAATTGAATTGAATTGAATTGAAADPIQGLFKSLFGAAVKDVMTVA